MSAQPDSPLADASQWLERARDDLLSAHTLLEHQESGWSVVAFLAQQCAEKALKAVLVSRQQPVPKTHDLVLLASRATLKESELRSYDVKRLNPWAVGGRCPGDIPEATKEQAAELHAAAKRVLLACQQVVSRADETVGGSGNAADPSS